jgi:DNA-binding XRE family transcriptional regulator
MAGYDPLAAMTDEELFDAARASGEERFPIEIVDRLLAKESPLKVYREYRGLTQRELARKARITPLYLSQIETGARRGSLKVLGALGKALAVEIDDLIR